MPLCHHTAKRKTYFIAGCDSYTPNILKLVALMNHQRSYDTMAVGRGVEMGRSTDLLANDQRSFWERRSRREKILIVLCCVMALLTICLIVAVVMLSIERDVPVNSTTTTVSPTTTVDPTTGSSITADDCNSTICKAAADNLKAILNSSVNPCDDFYSYVCSGWSASHPIPKDKDSVSIFGLLTDEITEKLMKVLPKTTFEDEDVRTKTKIYYQSCINNKSRERAGVKGLRSILDDLGGWPLLGDILTNYEWLDALLYVMRNLSTSWIISVDVSPDWKNTSNNVIQLDQTSLALGRNELIDENSRDARIVELLNAYKRFIIRSAKILGTKLNNNDLDRQVTEMIEFESTLAKYTRSMEERRDPESLYNKKTLSQLQSMLSERLDISSFLRKVFEDTANLTDDTVIIVNEPDYLNRTATLLSSGAVKMQTVADYVGWRVVLSYGPTTTQEFRDALFEFAKVSSGVKTPELLTKVCIDDTTDVFDFALGSIYVNSDFDIETKPEVEDMVASLKTAFSELLKENKWMNDKTKKEAENKLNEMIAKIAFPPWINDTKELNDRYEGLGEIKEDAYFENVLALSKFFIQKMKNRINQPFNRSTSWSAAPAVVNAFYEAAANTISFPAAILNAPFYTFGLPIAVNYGGIGAVIGHEITHGFDDEGSQYDAEGNLKNWWSKDIRKRFVEKAQCFVEQYGNYTEPITRMNVDGNSTLGENIADNGGIREAFKAYTLAVTKTEKNLKLPGLNLTPDQLFFISYSLTWCANQGKEHLENLIKYDVHSPARFRVQGPCSNFEEFSKAFNCPANSVMNPRHRCQLW